MAASRSISIGASTSRERLHERHYGYTCSDGTDEHSASSFPSSFWVVSGLMYKPCHGHTQNEQFIRPHRLCQGLDREPQPRCPDGGASSRRVHHGPHRDRRRRLVRRPGHGFALSSSMASRQSRGLREGAESCVNAATPGWGHQKVCSYDYGQEAPSLGSTLWCLPWERLDTSPAAGEFVFHSPRRHRATSSDGSSPSVHP